MKVLPDKLFVFDFIPVVECCVKVHLLVIFLKISSSNIIVALSCLYLCNFQDMSSQNMPIHPLNHSYCTFLGILYYHIFRS